MNTKPTPSNSSENEMTLIKIFNHKKSIQGEISFEVLYQENDLTRREWLEIEDFCSAKNIRVFQVYITNTFSKDEADRQYSLMAGSKDTKFNYNYSSEEADNEFEKIISPS